MNSICIVGRLTADPEQVQTNTSAGLATFTVAVDRNRKNGDTDFFRVKAWGKTAEFVCSYLSKGRLVSVSGRMESNKVEKDGRTNVYWDLVAENVNGLDKKPDGAGGAQSFARASKTPAPPPPLPGDDFIEDPFAED